MAQWARGYSGHTHDTKVFDLENAMRQAITAFANSEDVDRHNKSIAVYRLADRLIAARGKALLAHIARLSEPDLRDDNLEMIQKLEFRKQRLESDSAVSILTEFGFANTQNV